MSGDADDPAFLRYWDQVTVENAGKWGSVEATRDVMQWHDLDVAYAFAKEHGLPFRLHNLVWGLSQPAWLGRLSPADARDEVEEWIRLVGERYPDADFVDVVNEPFHAPPAYADALGGSGETRWDWVIATFQLARAAFPRAELGVNEYGILRSNQSTASYLRLVSSLRERGLIDTIGVQGHGLGDVPIDTISANLATLAASGLPVYVTELDVGIADDAEQATRLRSLMEAFAAQRGVRGVTFWGYRQDHIYFKSAYLLASDGTERPALSWLVEFRDSIGLPLHATPGL